MFLKRGKLVRGKNLPTLQAVESALERSKYLTGTPAFQFIVLKCTGAHQSGATFDDLLLDRPSSGEMNSLVNPYLATEGTAINTRLLTSSVSNVRVKYNEKKGL